MIATDILVIDASVAVKWLLNEEDSAPALALFRLPCKLIAPALIRVEVLATIAKVARRNQLSIADATRQIQRWHSTLSRRALFTVEGDKDYQDEVELSLAQRHSLYDCVYLALARKLGVPLATADKRLADIAHELGIEAFDWRSEPS
ncbi:MAG: type II toxin-antitoxin system VapC family toxin [Stenomitos rutilans HA7619-LM2]|jgi:predicted nucleic acid-binding protein|nr:type II toxin-antitoxin system VapC family toxin [Stenomitos rutilans HA7619-LM2]